MEGMRDRDMALEGGQGGGWWGRTGSAVEVTLRTCFNTKGTWLVSMLTSELHGNQCSPFSLLSLSTSVINMATSASVITPLYSDFLLCWTAAWQPAFQHLSLSPQSPPFPQVPSPVPGYFFAGEAGVSRRLQSSGRSGNKSH